MGRNNEDFSGGMFGLPPFPSIRPKVEGPAERVTVTPSEEDSNATGTESYSFDAPVGTTKKDVGKRIAGAIKDGFPKPKKVKFNKDEK